ncbi:MAG: M14-type cytosolic carboxypeptidase [Pseudomonadota bacterium]
MMVSINAAFDGGNILPISIDDPADVRLEIRRDAQSDFYQWFSFLLAHPQGEAVTLTILNAGGAAYVKGWENYEAVMSLDGETWQRVPTQYTGGKLTISLTMPAPRVHLAYFAPYPMTRHHDLIAQALASERFDYTVLGTTIDGRTMDYLRYGSGPSQVWLIARQHPGETMAEWWMEGGVQMLADGDDPIARTLAQHATVHIIPNMNPDGSSRGHLRTNAVGVNLNRVWASPTLERSPEVYHVRAKMHETGVDLCLDVHGDEALPYNFIAGFEGIPSITQDQQAGLQRYKALLEQLSPDFQTKIGYPAAPAGKANLSMSTNYIAETFGAVSMTLEMPFKDTVDTPHPLTGWSPERSAMLAQHCLQALSMYLPKQ